MSKLKFAYLSPYIFSLSDTQAAINIGTILARRCLEAGILYVHREKFNEDDSSRSSVKVSGLKMLFLCLF